MPEEMGNSELPVWGGIQARFTMQSDRLRRNLPATIIHAWATRLEAWEISRININIGGGGEADEVADRDDYPCGLIGQ